MIPQPEQRRALFDATRTAFGSVLAATGFSAPAVEPLPDRYDRIISHDDFERPLAVQMDALLWLAAASDSSRIAEMLDRVLGLERNRWREI